MTDAPGWRPDVLPGWQARDLVLRPDAYGEAVATLVRREGAGGAGAAPRGAALYVHGFVDYFFHPHLGDLWSGLGRDLYALDLRGYGRSIREHRPPNLVADIADHAEDIDAALRAIHAEGHREVVLMGHSTGGLIAALWAHARAERPQGPGVSGLVLNSPWLDLNRGWFDRVVTTRAAAVLATVAPDLVVGRLSPHYGRWLHDPAGGAAEYDQAWKPDDGFDVRARWLASVRRGHRAVARGLHVDVPVLVCTSDASGPADRWHDALGSTDSVLSVEQTERLAPRLGPDVTLVQVPGGIHDLALAPEPARTAYLDAVRDWVRARLDA